MEFGRRGKGRRVVLSSCSNMETKEMILRFLVFSSGSTSMVMFVWYL